MKKLITTKFQSFGNIGARDIVKKLGIEHVYGIANSVCDLTSLTDQKPKFDKPYDMGYITKEDLGLAESGFTMKDVLIKCEEKGYEKPVASDIFNYISTSNDLRFGSRTAIMSIMDEVRDGDGCPGRIYFQPDEQGYLEGLGFIKIDESQRLSNTAKFFVKKVKE